MTMSPKSYISKLFADAVYTEIREKRFGLKRCSVSLPDADLLFEIRLLRKAAQQKRDSSEIDTKGCGLERLNEKINSL
jgi:hypothetical protein